jgi:hypothetical protein
MEDYIEKKKGEGSLCLNNLWILALGTISVCHSIYFWMSCSANKIVWYLSNSKREITRRPENIFHLTRLLEGSAVLLNGHSAVASPRKTEKTKCKLTEKKLKYLVVTSPALRRIYHDVSILGSRSSSYWWQYQQSLYFSTVS